MVLELDFDFRFLIFYLNKWYIIEDVMDLEDIDQVIEDIAEDIKLIKSRTENELKFIFFLIFK